MEVSLQLYSIHEETKKNFREAIKHVAEIGYKGVEFAGYGGLTAEEAAELLRANHLYSVGCHCGLPVFAEAFAEELQLCKTLGSKYIICPWAKLDTREEVDKLIRILNSCADIARKANVRIGYHNHNFEFNRIDGKYILDIIAENTNDNVILELDVFWLVYAGVDPVEYINRWGKKIELIHMKQINADMANVDAGDGIIDMRKIKEASKYARYFIVEHEEFDKPVWDSIKNDYDYLSRI